MWHPFTAQSAWPDDEPLVIERAEGMHLFDTDGNRYLDGVSSLWLSVHGHGVPEIDAAIRDQLGRLDHATFLGLTHEPGIELAERLLDTAPAGLSRVFYAGDGSSAVEAAIKMAYQATAQATGAVRPLYRPRRRGLPRRHPRGGQRRRHRAVPRDLPADPARHPHGVVSRSAGAGPDPGGARAEVLAEMRAVLEREGDRVCAVVIEPLVQAAGGMLTHDPAFVRGVRALCDEFAALMVVDEVATGIGRTGRMWAVDHAGVTPDLMTCGKGLTGGYLPLSAVLARESVYEAFLGAPSQAARSSTGTPTPPTRCAAPPRWPTSRLMAEREHRAHAAQVGERMGELLKGVDDVRRRARGPSHRNHDRHRGRAGDDRTGFAVCQAARRRGVWVRPLGDVVVLMPPLAIGDEDLETLCGVVEESIREVVR